MAARSSKEYRKLNKERVLAIERKSRFKRVYGITPEDYAAMIVNQNGLCAICHKPETSLSGNGEIKQLAVDHDHSTGAVRGLLCDHCNKAIGLMQDSVDRLRNAAIYLEKHGSPDTQRLLY